MEYLFQSERLGFRKWQATDIQVLDAINSDPEVMAYFPSTYSRAKSHAFLARMVTHHHNHGFCYFPVELLVEQQMIGFIGMATQTFPADFTPCVDIGWRLAKAYWGFGYATEGAKRCLLFGFGEIGLEHIYSMAVADNSRSTRVMEKIGMKKMGYFNHPDLKEYRQLEKCVLYKIDKPVDALSSF